MIFGQASFAEVSFASAVDGAEAPSSDTVITMNPGEILFSTGDTIVFTLTEISPIAIFPGYLSDGESISFPLSLFPILSAEEADVVTGDWRKIIQAMLMHLNEYLLSITLVDRPQTIHTFMLENWNAKSPMFEYGYGNKRIFQVSFNINYAFQKIKDEVQ